VIIRIREFDSVSQRGVRDLPFVEFGSAAMPVFLGKRSTLDYFPTASLAMDVGVRRQSAFASGARGRKTPRPHGKETANHKFVPDAGMSPVKARRPVDVAATAGTPRGPLHRGTPIPCAR